MKKLFNGQKLFSYPKSIYTVKDTIKIISDDKANDIILDFFAGSGTTGDAVMQLNKEDNGNRKFILIEQLDEHIFVCKKRIKKQCNGDFLYCELMKYNEAFMDKIQEAKSSKELIALWKDMAKNSFLNWYVNPKIPEEALNDFIKIGQNGTDSLGQKPVNPPGPPYQGGNKDNENGGNPAGLKAQKRLLADLLNKNQLYVLWSEIEDRDFQVTKEDKQLNKLFFNGKEK